MNPSEVTFSSTRMGGPLTLRGYAPDLASKHVMLAAFAAADGEVARIEDLLTDYRDSPLGDINAAAGRAPTKVSDELFALILQANTVAEESQGVFDITYAAVGMLWRMARQTKQLPEQDRLAAAQQLVNYRAIVLDHAEKTVFLPKPGMRIGLGGVGKGYAVDRAYQLIRERGVSNFIVNGAGDIRTHANDDALRPWYIAVHNPFSPRAAAAGGLLIKTGAVATSGDYQRFFIHEGVRYHHVLDARSGHIRQDVASVTITARTALMADMYATTVMAAGVQDGMAFLRKRSAVRAVLIDRSGKIHRT